MDSKYIWTMRETLIVAVIGAVFAVLYLGWVQLWLILQAIFGPLTMDVMLGFWFIASIVAAAIIRKPGVALAAELLAAIVELLLGAPGGLLIVLSGLIQGLGAEVAFAATGYRKFNLPVLIASGVCAAIFSFAYNWIRFDYGSFVPTLLITLFVLRLLSGAILAGFLGHLIAEALYKTGVLSGLKIDRDKRTALA